MTQATEISNPPAEARRQGVPLWRSIAASTALQSMVPVVVALIVGAIIILMFGNDPLKFYSMVFKRGLLSWVGLQEVLTRMAPLLLIAAGLIFCYRAGVWNLGMDGQFLIGAVLAAYFAVPLAEALPRGVALGAACAIGALAGATQTIIPAWLKIRYGTNEIVSSLMMSLLGLSLTSWLIKGPMHDPNSTAVQTVTLPVEDRFPRLFDTYVSSALLLGFVAIVVAHFVMSRTAFGLRLSMVGANRRAAVHAGLAINRLTALSFAIGGALTGLAGAVEVTAIAGNVRADENPGYGFAILPLVFLARFNGWGTLFLTFIYALLLVGGQSASRRMQIPQEFLLVLVGLVLLFTAISEVRARRRAR